ncbi:hypothetical protein, partial [Helicobacter typhlonius]|uniref:hypothetical protein n=1 Tax=Helicobacter typhlonius TaxID=76936 RepID=UPI002FE3947E
MKALTHIPFVALISFSGLIADSLELKESGTESRDSSGGGVSIKKVNIGRYVVTASGYEQDIKEAPAS